MSPVTAHEFAEPAPNLTITNLSATKTETLQMAVGDTDFIGPVGVRDLDEVDAAAMNDKPTEIGRLAMRVEGEWWVAYWTPQPHSMDNAVRLGQIRLRLAVGSVKEEFMEVMRAAFAVVVKDVTGKTPTWSGPQPAPESERSGRA